MAGRKKVPATIVGMPYDDARRPSKVRRLREARARIEAFRSQEPKLEDPEFEEWEYSVSSLLRELFGDGEFPLRFARLTFRPISYSVLSPPRWHDDPAPVWRSDLALADKILGEALEEADVQTATTTSSHPLSQSAQELLGRIASGFHAAVRQLRQRHGNRASLDVEDEYDVQDLLHVFLRLFFADVREEEYTPSYAGKSSRMDFLLKEERVVVECKMTRAGLDAKTLGSQLIDDVARYRGHPGCHLLVCLVYDPDGRINNPRGVERDLEKLSNKPAVQVFIVPR